MTDSNGRFVIVTGTLCEKQVILVSVYSPSWDDYNFVSLDSHLLIMGGDMNCVIDTTLDRSSLRSTSVMKMSQAFSTFMSQYGLVDTDWWTLGDFHIPL